MCARYFVIFAIAFATVSLPGCAANRQNLQAVTAQDVYPANYEAQIKQHFARTLKDPYSAVYEISPPRPGRVWAGLLFGGYREGYVVYMTLNAKNSYGGYVGVTPHWILFKNGQIDYVAGQGETF